MTSIGSRLAAIVAAAWLAVACASPVPTTEQNGSPVPSVAASPQAIMTPSPLPTPEATSPPTATPAPTMSGNLLGSPSAGDWPTYGFNTDNSVDNTAETQISPDNVGQLQEAWQLDTGGVTGTPVIVAGIAYFADWLGDVYAVDAKTSAIAWQQHVSDAPISASVALSDELVIAGDLAGGLHALRRTDGQEMWSTKVNDFEASLFASPVVVNNDMVVVGMTDSELHEPDDPAFSASIVAYDLSGNLRWRFLTDPDNTPGLWVTVWSSAAYDADRGLLYIGTGNTNQAVAGNEDSSQNLPLSDGVLALNADTGDEAWFYKVQATDAGEDLDVGSSPNLFKIGNRDVVGAGSKGGDYVVLDRDTGNRVWRVHLTDGGPGGGIMDTAAVGDGHVYVASNQSGNNATIFALDTADGTFAWPQPQELSAPAYGGSMALANGVLYRGLWSGGLVALDASSGTELWRNPDYAPLNGGAVISNGMLYAGYGSGREGAMTAPHGGVVAWQLP